jgi:hypothetical protein
MTETAPALRTPRHGGSNDWGLLGFFTSLSQNW